MVLTYIMLHIWYADKTILQSEGEEVGSKNQHNSFAHEEKALKDVKAYKSSSYFRLD